MSNQQLPLFPTTVVGSMPRSDFVRDLLALENEPLRSEAETQKEMDAAVRYIIALQEAAGIDIISDGEWRRRSYIGVIADIASGFELSMQEGMHWTTAVDKIRLKQPGVIAAEAAFLQQHTDRLTKVCLPSPYLLGQRMWDPKNRGTHTQRVRHSCMISSIFCGMNLSPSGRQGRPSPSLTIRICVSLSMSPSGELRES